MDRRRNDGMSEGTEAVPKFLALSPPIQSIHVPSNDHPVRPNPTTSSQSSPAPIAICGLALRLPGGVRNAEDFWQLLMSKRDARAPVPLDRYNVHGFSEELGSKESIKSQYGYFLEEDLSGLDTSFFSMTADELAKCDPQQRQVLEVTRECLENAGEVDYRGKDIGCYVGTFAEDWLQMNARDSQHLGRYLMTGHLDFMIANRVSYEYDLHGPSQVYKTGCSASLVALHEACRALQSGDCSAALVAGTNLIIGPATTIEMTGEGVISPNASCRPFDAGADGFARAEAINMVYIKKLDDALRDGNPIRAVIPNTATNCAGRSGSLMQPNGRIHEQLMRKVYQGANLDPSLTAFVECHGTGTPTGDPIETRAVGNVFGTEGIIIGSVKANVGHSEGASGLTSLIKAVLALEHSTIPPNIKFDIPNAKIPFEEKKLKVPTESTAWPADRARRISVNSFGIGGANAHVIVESLKETRPGYQENSKERKVRTITLLPVSANTQVALQEHIVKIQEYAKRSPERAVDLAYTLSIHREHMSHRAYALIGSGDTIISNSLKAPLKPPGVVMIFTGQGSQWAGMAAELLAADDGFRKDIKGMDTVLGSLRHPPDWSIEDELQKPANESNLHRAEIAQPVCTALQIALVNALCRLGVRPSAVVGHSSGEIAAAYASGAISLRAALIFAFYRGFATKAQTLSGGMAVIGLGAQDIKGLLPQNVVIACENSEESTTVSGDVVALESFLAQVKAEKPDTLARRLKVDMAYHSPHMQSVGIEYLRLIEAELLGEDIGSTCMDAPLFSSVTAEEVRDGRALAPQYWISNLVSPVLFRSAINTAIEKHSKDAFLEIGAHSTLAGPLRSILSKAGHKCTYVPTMLRDKDCDQSFLSAIGLLYQSGVEIKFSELNGPGRILHDLPTYSWDRNTGQWYEPQVSRDWRFRKFGYHNLLGLRIPGTTDMEPCWRNVLSVEEETWLQDHKVLDEPILSFGGYCAMAREAMRQIAGDSSEFSLRKIVVSEAMRFTDNKPVEVRTTLRSDSHDDRDSITRSWRFVISSYSEIGWVINCEGQLIPRQVSLVPSHPGSKELFRKINPSKWYKALANVGFFLGPQYPQYSSIETSGGEQIAHGRMCNSRADAASVSSLHPSVLDACLVLTTVVLANGLVRRVKLPIVSSVDQIDITNGKEEMDVFVWSTDGGSSYTVEGVAGDKVIVRFAGVGMTQLESKQPSLDPCMAAQLHWLPHFDFIDPSSLFKPPAFNMEVMKLREELTLLCAIDCSEKIEHLETTEIHYTKYRDWFRHEILRARTEDYSILEKQAVDDILATSASHRRDKIEHFFGRIFAIWPEDAITMTVRLIWERIEQLFTNQEHALNVLLQDNLLIKVYNACAFDFSGVIKSMSHMNPELRILEVGAGTGGTTATFMESLVGAGGQPGYSLYTFTDISNGFFPQAKKRFSYASNMDFKVFDISQGPFQQGFAKNTYDLIIATNVVHATPCLAETLRNLHPLLNKNGRLILTELTSVMNIWSFVFGTVPGWWMGEADGRPSQPHVSLERWDAELRAAGFTGAETTVHDAAPPYQYCTVIVSRPALALPEAEESRKLSLVCRTPHEGVSKLLEDGFSEHGYLATTGTFDDVTHNRQSIISVLDLEHPLIDNIDDTYIALENFLHDHTPQNLLWLCPPCQMSCHNPRHAQVISLAKTYQSKPGMSFHILEIDSNEPNFVALVVKVFVEMHASNGSDVLLPDREFAVHNGIVHVARYHPLSISDQTAAQSHDIMSEASRSDVGVTRSFNAGHYLSPTTTDSSGYESSSTPPSSLDTEHDIPEPGLEGRTHTRSQGFATSRDDAILKFDPDAAYMVTGDLEELETSFLSWLVEHGARTLVLLRESASDGTKTRNLAADMASLSCTLLDVAGQASSPADVERAMAMTGRPIKGLFGFVTMEKATTSPEIGPHGRPRTARSAIQEALVLHTALMNEPLQFFLLTTCLPSMLGKRDSECFDSANTFLESFSQYRHSLGLPASGISSGPAHGSSKAIDETTVLDLIEYMLLGSKITETSKKYLDPSAGWTNSGHSLLDPKSLLPPSNAALNGETPSRTDRRLAFFLNSRTSPSEGTSSSSTNNALLDLLERARDTPSILSPESEQTFSDAALIVAHAIGTSALEFRLRQDEEVDCALSLTQMGMDSLKIIELRKWWRKNLQCEVELRELSEERALKELGEVATRRIYETMTGNK